MTKTNTRKIAGFTLDQTILVVAVIAILATIIISSVAWNVLNRASATKFTAHLNQIGDAIGQFYQDNDYVWPADATELQAYLAGYSLDGAATDALTTPFGGELTSHLRITDATAANGGNRLSSTGATVVNASTLPTTPSVCSPSTSINDCYISVTITNAQIQELKKANDAIDGSAEATPEQEGRLRWVAGASDTARVTAVYLAVKLYN